MTPAQTRDALVRVTKFVDEYQKMRGLHPDNIHSLHFGMEHGATLTVSDLRALLAALPVGDGEPAMYAHPDSIAAVRTCDGGSLWVSALPNADNYAPLYTAPPAAVPAGFVLVPVEPTQSMLDANGDCPGYPEGKAWLERDARETWKAMLAARPDAPAGEKGT